MSVSLTNILFPITNLFGHGGGSSPDAGQQGLKTAADLLHMSDTDLMNQLNSGATLDSLAKSHGVDPAVLHQAVDNATHGSSSSTVSNPNAVVALNSATSSFNDPLNTSNKVPTSTSSGAPSGVNTSYSDLLRLSGGQLQIAA